MPDRVTRILSFLGLSSSKEASTKEDNEFISEVIQKFNALHLLGGAESNPEFTEVSSWLSLSQSFGAEDLAKVEASLYMKSYLVGQSFTAADAAIFESIRDKHCTSVSNFTELSRWYNHIQRICPLSDNHTVDVGSSSRHFMCLPSTLTSTASPQPVLKAQVASSTVAPTPTTAVTIIDDLKLSSSVVTAEATSTSTSETTSAAPAPMVEKKERKDKKEKKVDVATVDHSSVSTVAAEGDDLDPSKLDIRVGVVVKCWNHPDSDKLLCEEINVGEAVLRTIASGIRPHYAAEDLVNRKVCVLANLKDRNLAGFKSQGMVLCAVSADHTIIKLLEAPASASAGDRITFPGFSGEPASSAQMAKKKILEKLASQLRTDSAGVAHWAASPFTVDEGVCVAHDLLADAVVS